MQYVQRGLVIVLVGLLVGCGWQLRGGAGGGFDGVAIAVTGAAGNRLEAKIARQLRDLGADVVAEAAQAQTQLRIESAGSSRRTLATDADDFASEYELTYQIRFSLEPGGLAADDAMSGSSQTVRTSAAFSVSADNLQAAQAEEQALQRDLEADAITLLLARVGRML
ncbi:MAG: LPS assembly lipoprotein LptE [Spiribacter sp.]|nr:LPS assembly lipoprotein LptE [Spiribacter sp.]MDR9480262.1 LPS assembly lipoprotein LptE [Spiribacter sp.]